MPSVRGHGTVVYLRVDDALVMRALAAELPAGAPAVVVGGGLLGLEAAGALTTLGCDTARACPAVRPAGSALATPLDAHRSRRPSTQTPAAVTTASVANPASTPRRSP